MVKNEHMIFCNFLYITYSKIRIFRILNLEMLLNIQKLAKV